MQDICEYCNSAINGIFISTGSGMAHEKCYYEQHPYKRLETFEKVLVNCDDQVLVRELILKYMPSELEQIIVDEFNKIMESRYKQKIKS